jgi:hypothetical protein
MTERTNDHIQNNTPHYDIVDKDTRVTQDEIFECISRIQNKYSGNAEQKHLNQMYDIGILMTNKPFDTKKLIDKLTKIIDNRSRDPLRKVQEYKRSCLIDALKRGITDGMSDTYRMAYDNMNRYQYDDEKLKKRAHIDSVVNNFNVE